MLKQRLMSNEQIDVDSVGFTLIMFTFASWRG